MGREPKIPSWRIERDRGQLYLVETPVSNEERTHLARYAFRPERLT